MVIQGSLGADVPRNGRLVQAQNDGGTTGIACGHTETLVGWTAAFHNTLWAPYAAPRTRDALGSPGLGRPL